MRMLRSDNYSVAEQGQALVLIALMMVGMMALLGLVVDGGNTYLQRRRAQNAADAAALAGAIAVGQQKSDAQVRAQIDTFAAKNGITSPSTNVVAYYTDSSGNELTAIGSGSVPNGATGVAVTPTVPFNLFFLGVVGQTDATVRAKAKSTYGSLVPDSIQPLTLPCNQSVFTNCFQKDQVLDIFEGSGSGNFGWLSWNGENDTPYTADELNPSINTLGGYVDPHHVCPNGVIAQRNGSNPCWVQGSSGVGNSSDVGAKLDAWITRAASGVPLILIVHDQCEPIDSKTGLCKASGGGSSVNYRIKGFAAFYLQSYSLPQKRITGKFKDYWVTGKSCPTCLDTGVHTARLRP